MGLRACLCSGKVEKEVIKEEGEFGALDSLGECAVQPKLTLSDVLVVCRAIKQQEKGTPSVTLPTANQRISRVNRPRRLAG